MFGFIRKFARRSIKPPMGSGEGLQYIRIGNITAGFDLTSPDDSLKLAAFWRCVHVLSNSAAILPWKIYKREKDGTRSVDHDHPIGRLLDRVPNDEMTAYSFRVLAVQHRMLWGNFYAEIERDRRGRPVNLWPIHPSRVDLWRDDNGKLWYRISQAGGDRQLFEPREIFHVAGLSGSGLRGMSILEAARQSLGNASATDSYTGGFFRNGLHAGGVIQLSDTAAASEKTIAIIRDQFIERSAHGRVNAPVILDRGMEWKPSTVNPDNAQLLDTRHFNVEEICRWCNVPPYLAYARDSEARANFEIQSREFIQYSVQPILTCLNQEADRKLLGATSPFYSELDTMGFSRANPEARARYFQTMRNSGVMSVNEIRDQEGLDGIGPEGDFRVMQVQYQPIGKDGAPTNPNPVEPAGTSGNSGDTGSGNSDNGGGSEPGNQPNS